MRTKYLGLAVMTVLLGAKALSLPRQSSTNGEVAKKSVGGNEDLEIRGLPMEPPCDHTDRASNTTAKAPQERETRVANTTAKAPETRISNTAPKAPQDPEPTPNAYQSVLGAIRFAIAKGRKTAAVVNIKLVLIFTGPPIPIDVLEVRINVLVDSLPQNLSTQELQRRLAQLADVLLQRNQSKETLERSLDELKGVFQRGEGDGKKDDGKKDGERKDRERKDRERKVQAKAVDPEADPGLRAFMPDLTKLLPGPEVDSDGESTNDFDKRDDGGDDGDDGYPPYCCYPWELYCYPEDYCPGYY